MVPWRFVRDGGRGFPDRAATGVPFRQTRSVGNILGPQFAPAIETYGGERPFGDRRLNGAIWFTRMGAIGKSAPQRQCLDVVKNFGKPRARIR
jgi:hypothetical protein